jgi:hypothetical protein
MSSDRSFFDRCTRNRQLRNVAWIGNASATNRRPSLRPTRTPSDSPLKKGERSERVHIRHLTSPLVEGGLRSVDGVYHSKESRTRTSSADSLFACGDWSRRLR